MLWLLDGYNVLHAMGLMPAQRGGPHALEKARRALLGRLASVLGDQAGHAVVVFDAAEAPPDVPAEQTHKGVHVRFARQRQEADDLIEDLIHDNASRNLTVVSNDHRLVRAARQRGCQPRSCEAFIDWLEKKRRARTPTRDEPAEKSQGMSAAEGDPLLAEWADLDDDPRFGGEFPEF